MAASTAAAESSPARPPLLRLLAASLLLTLALRATAAAAAPLRADTSSASPGDTSDADTAAAVLTAGPFRSTRLQRQCHLAREAVAPLAAALEADSGLAAGPRAPPLQALLPQPLACAPHTDDAPALTPWRPAEENAAALIAASQRPAPLRLAVAAAAGATLLRVSTAARPAVGIYIDGYDALMPVLDPAAIAAYGARTVDRRKAPLPPPSAIGLEVVVATEGGLARLCGRTNRPAHCSLVMPPGAVVLPGSTPGLPPDHATTRLYEVFHPRLAAAAFRAPEAEGTVGMVRPPSGQPPKVPYLRGVPTSSARFLFAQRVSWALQLPVVVHIVSAAALAGHVEPWLAPAPRLPFMHHYVVRSTRDLADCDAAFAADVVRRLYTWLAVDDQRHALRAYLQRLAAAGSGEAHAPLAPRQAVAYNAEPSLRAACDAGEQLLQAVPEDVAQQLQLRAAPLGPQSRLCRLLRLRLPAGGGGQTAGGNTAGGNTADGSRGQTAVLGILSHDSNVAARNAMREQLWRRAGPAYADVQHVFLLDQPPWEPDLAAPLFDEAEQHGDIVFLPTLALGRAVGFGRKVFLWLALAAQLFPSAAFVGKLDDDVLLCLAGFAAAARRLRQEQPAAHIYWGFINGLGRATQRVAPSAITHNGLRADEQFVVLSQPLVGHVLAAGWPPPCSTLLSDYAGAMLGNYVQMVHARLQSPVEVRADNQGMCHHLNKPGEPGLCDAVDVSSEPFRYSADFCRRHLSAHPNKDVASALDFYSHAAVFDAAALEPGAPHNAA